VEPMKNSRRALDDTLYLACIWVAGLSVFVMCPDHPWGVFARYVLGTGSSWPEPIAILLMVVFTFIGAAASYRAGAHIAVAMLTDRMPRLRKTMSIVVAIVDGDGDLLFMTIWGTSCAWLPGTSS
jgi:TRAP-type C4-dicarboxylate transport system permease small subunit